MALQYSFPSPLGFTSELIGNEPCCLSSTNWPFDHFVPLSFSTMLLDCSTGWPGSAYCSYLIHKSIVRGKHFRKGLFQVHLFLERWFARSGWWHVVLIVPPSITLTVIIILTITPTLALNFVLIAVAPIMTLLLRLTQINP